MESGQGPPNPPSKLDIIEKRIESLLASSSRIRDLSCNIFNKLLGSLPETPTESSKDQKEPAGKLAILKDRLDTVHTRLSIAENGLKLIDKETE